MSKVIFLDIDGVLNAAYSKSRSPDGFIGVDDDKVILLKSIVDATGALIVLTSTWQKEFIDRDEGISPSGKYLIKKLRKQHLTISGFTRKWAWDRGEGIREYLNDNPEIESWIALDDEIFPDFHEYGIIPHLVQTNFRLGGLNQSHVDEAIRLLNGDDA